MHFDFHSWEVLLPEYSSNEDEADFRSAASKMSMRVSRPFRYLC